MSRFVYLAIAFALGAFAAFAIIGTHIEFKLDHQRSVSQ